MTDGKQPVAQVVLGNTTRAYDKTYDYRIPEHVSGLRPGMRVIVPFGRANLPKEAWVVLLLPENNDPTIQGKKYQMKTILEQVDHSPILSEEHIKLAAWMRDRFFCTWHQAITIMLPSGIRLVENKLIRLSDAFRAKIASEMACKQNDSTVESIVDTDALKQQGEITSPLHADSTPLQNDESTHQQNNAITTQQNDETVLAMTLFHHINGISISNISGELPQLMPLLQQWIQEGKVIREVSYEQKARTKTERAAIAKIDQETLDALLAAHAIKSHPQQLALEMLMEEEIVSVTDLYLLPGVGNATLKALEKKGWLEFTEIARERDPFKNLVVSETYPMQPTEEQDTAFIALNTLLQSEEPTEALVHGVTGSGKTELYLRLIDATLQKGAGCIVLVPEISLTPQMVERFKGRFGERIAVQHSRLSVGERMDQWRRIQNGELDVVIGARSAVFAPIRQLGIIIIDEEHELAYKSESVPRYDARLVARARINLNKGLLVSGSATPSLETMQRAQNGTIHLVTLKHRVMNRPMPIVDLVDMRKELAEGSRSIFSRILLQYMEENRLNNEQTILFLNRRGFATFLLCRDCGYALKCPSCNIALTMHRSGRAICHYCGYMIPVPHQCPDCQGKHLKAYGAGTQRLEDDLNASMAGYRVIRMDLDTTTGKNGHAKLLDAFKNREADVLIGTQMVAKGHDFPEVTLVGIMAADAMLFTGDYRAGERTFQLVTQAAGRAGRAEKPGRVLVQAYNLDEYALKTALHHDYDAFFQQEIALRKQLFYPPFCHMGMVRLQGLNDAKTAAMMEEISTVLDELIAKTDQPSQFIRSPHSKSPFAMIAERYRYRVIVRHTSAARLCKLFHVLQNAVWKRCDAAGVDLNLDIDPVSML